MLLPTSILFRGQDFSGPGPVLTDQDKPESDQQSWRALLCRTCGQPVTTFQERIEINGKHSHTLFNPMGLLFEVGCFSQAPGCRFEGAFTQDFTWFPGHAWRFAMCRRCGTHLGWEYRSQVSSFAGLILSELRAS